MFPWKSVPVNLLTDLNMIVFDHYTGFKTTPMSLLSCLSNLWVYNKDIVSSINCEIGGRMRKEKLMDDFNVMYKTKLQQHSDI